MNRFFALGSFLPNQYKGGIAVWLLVVVGVLSLSAFSNTVCPIPERAFFALILSAPSMLLVQRGHFGLSQWQFPSIAAQIYLVWTAGLLPSFIAATPPSTGIYFYDSSSKELGAIAYLIWFFAFAISVGSPFDTAKERVGKLLKSSRQTHFDWITLLILFLVWTVGCVGAWKESGLSSWSANLIMEAVGGSPIGAIILIYSAFVGLIPILAIWALLRAEGPWKWIFRFALIVGIMCLIVYSNRRLIIFSVILVLYFLWQSGKDLNKRTLIVAGFGAMVLLGPLLWPIRIAIQNPDLLRAQGDLFQVAGESIYRYATDAEFRDIASNAGKDNLRSGRFNYADTYLAAVQWTREHGPNRSPSILFAPITLIPSFIWPAKNEIAAQLNVKKQFNIYGISNEPDFPLSPIQECFFQYGLPGVLVGGLLWGFFGRILSQTFATAWNSAEGMIVWIPFYFGAMSFEGYFSAFLSQSREALAAGGIAWISRRYFIHGRG